ncbi:universal stress protein [Methylobacterium sp. yr668]|uniref:universal stress protein n=1 Tax=Methylobacterium sp. yr668 TaxID=1761801 RepID=UPI0008F0A51A|nr:universal stress protein [Methylobacterium sp. yr668]SFT22878.1 Nucleotide-binding universal stress protein, UspA family [Methylobacterium sp. yr668]
MKISNIMVSVDLGPAAADRVQLAAGLAQQFGSKLTGVAARPVLGPMPVGDMLEVERVWALEERLTDEQLAEAKALFEREAGQAPKTSWRSAPTDPLAFLGAQARTADLVVVGRQGPADGDAGPMAVSTGGLLMEVGRPVLVVPPGIEHLAVKRVVVAWKDTPEARRALHDALPFLRQTEQLCAVAVGPDAQHVGAEGAAEYLSGHGIKATTHLLRKPEIGPADEILRFAGREDADLIVMGAYGHSRLREWAFGGATREVLQSTPVCCLMSH